MARKIPLRQTVTANWLTKNEKADRVKIGSIGFCSGGRQVRDLKRVTDKKADTSHSFRGG